MVVIRIAIVLVIWSLLRKVANKPPRRIVYTAHEENPAPNSVELITHEPTFKESQAMEDIDHIAYCIEQVIKKGEYLELERDACVKYGKEWHKWNDKCLANEEKHYKLVKQMNKAREVLGE